MIYRVHRPHNADGSFGSFIGYINLCQGHINPAHICENLISAKLVPEHWFNPIELQSVASNSDIIGIQSYALVRRPPHRNHLFYLQPIETKIGYNDNRVFGKSLTFSDLNINIGHLTSRVATLRLPRDHGEQPAQNVEVQQQRQLYNYWMYEQQPVMQQVAQNAAQGIAAQEDERVYQHIANLLNEEPEPDNNQ